MEWDQYYVEVPEFKITYVDAIIEQKHAPVIHYHNVFELDLFVKSDNDCFIKNTRYPLQDFSLLFICPRDMHILHYKAGSQYSRFVINFSADILRPYLAIQGLDSILDQLETRLLTLPPDVYSRILALFLAVYKCKSNPGNYSEKQLTAMQQSHLLVLFWEVYCLLNQYPSSTPTSKPSLLIKNVIQHMDQSYSEPLTLDLLQETFYVNKYYLCHIFKKETGVPIIEYLNCRRIIEAQKLLMKTHLSISEICFACGFNNLQHFYRTFKKYTTYSPKQYRLPQSDT